MLAHSSLLWSGKVLATFPTEMENSGGGKASQLKDTPPVQKCSGGTAGPLLSRRSVVQSSSLHVKVSLDKTLNSKLLPKHPSEFEYVCDN